MHLIIKSLFLFLSLSQSFSTFSLINAITLAQGATVFHSDYYMQFCFVPIQSMPTQNHSSVVIISDSVLKSFCHFLFSLGLLPAFQNILQSLIFLACKMGVIIILPLWAIVRIKRIDDLKCLRTVLAHTAV